MMAFGRPPRLGCEAMKYLIEETDFPAQVRARVGRPPLLTSSPEARAYLVHRRVQKIQALGGRT